MALDALTIWACGWLAYLWQGNFADSLMMPSRYKMLMLVASVWMLATGSDMYRSWRLDGLIAMLRTVGTTWLGTVLVMVLWLFITKTSQDISRVWFATWVIGTLLALYGQRVLVFTLLRALRSRGFNYKTLLIVGDDANTRTVHQALNASAWTGFKLVAQVPSAELAAWMKGKGHQHIDEIWLCLPLSQSELIQAALDELRHSTANIRLVPNFFEMKLINYGISDVMGVPMLDISASPITGSLRIYKTIEDYLLASLILLVAALPMLAIAIAIKLTSRGPVLFKQYRDGWNGEKILIYKFRSMTVHQESGGQVTQATKNDCRLTRIGGFLRRTSLDELPQFINVLQGRMSIVGPRPHALAHNDYYKELVPGYMLRHKVKPGITGLAQVNGYRGETDTLDKMHMRVEYDKQYIESMSIWLDLKIIFLTIFKGFLHKNAY